MSILLTDTDGLVDAGYEPDSIDAIAKRNDLVERSLASPLGPHLRAVENADVVEASGTRLLNARAIKDEIDEYAPSRLLFPFGFFVERVAPVARQTGPAQPAGG